MTRGSRALMWSAAGMIATAVLVHLYDPESGEHRRRMLRRRGLNVARRLGKGAMAVEFGRYGVRRVNTLASRLRNAAAHF